MSTPLFFPTLTPLLTAPAQPTYPSLLRLLRTTLYDRHAHALTKLTNRLNEKITAEDIVFLPQILEAIYDGIRGDGWTGEGIEGVVRQLR